ncbi:hypothetical protein [Flavobacterium gyeonganense]|uniref:Uncharacterized protein n=1 Tax=Flavobacterium gyeonganense TaxID=1310418 RepID=A0ABV5HDR9_9FLAO|nr:hypothetical protein [Flavobacterium gyeonganense]
MKKHILLVILLIFSSSVKTIANNMTTIDPFEGFKIMSLPRENVPIGALWNLSLGPIGTGVGPEFLQNSKSFSSFNQITDKNFSDSINLGLQNYMTLNGRYSANNKSQFKVEDVSIVTLNSTDVLKNSIGQYIVYEAIKISKISVIIEKNKDLEIKASLLKLFKNLDITNETEVKNEKKLEMTGVDLYIAYRIVKVEKAKSYKEKLKFTSEGYSGNGFVKLSSSYSSETDNVVVQMCPCSIQKCMGMASQNNNDNNYGQLLSKCAVEKGYDFTVIFKNRINVKTGTPEEFKFKVFSGAEIRNINMPLYSISTSEGLEVSYLNLDNIIFAPISGTLIYMLIDRNYRKANIFTTKVKFTNFVPDSAAGW